MIESRMATERVEALVGFTKADAPVLSVDLMERIVERGNLLEALRRVQSNGGSAGVDKMSVERLPEHLKKHWPAIRSQLLSGTYCPLPVRRVEIPKPQGGVRLLGIPCVLDRLIQQAILQVLQPQWDPFFSERSFGFRPNRSAHQAVAMAQEYVRKGYRWIVDMDLEKFFDRVNHDKLMSLVKKRVGDKRLLSLINRFLKSGGIQGESFSPSEEGTPQGGPLSPLLANLLLDELDQELERRGHCFVRYADDCNVDVKSQRAGERVLASLSEFLSKKLKLSVNHSKSAVDCPWNRKFLGFTFTNKPPFRRKISETSLKRFKDKIRLITRRTRGSTITTIIDELKNYLTGWKAYYGFSEVPSPLRDLDKWIRRRLRCYLWKQWGRKGYRELVKRGVSRELAWNTAKSAHGPWRLSRSPGLAFALTEKYFSALGLPLLVNRQIRLNQPNRGAANRRGT